MSPQDPYIDLAHAVILSAFKDAVKPLDQRHIGTSLAERSQAREFLTTQSDVLTFWCRLGRVSEDKLLARARERFWQPYLVRSA